jgi:hypothetical protein
MFSILGENGETRGSFTVSGPRVAALSTDGAMIAILTSKRTIEVRDVETGDLVATAHRGTDIQNLACAASGNALVVAGDYGFDVEVWHFDETGPYARLRCG